MNSIGAAPDTNAQRTPISPPNAFLNWLNLPHASPNADTGHVAGDPRQHTTHTIPRHSTAAPTANADPLAALWNRVLETNNAHVTALEEYQMAAQAMRLSNPYQFTSPVNLAAGPTGVGQRAASILPQRTANVDYHQRQWREMLETVDQVRDAARAPAPTR